MLLKRRNGTLCFSAGDLCVFAESPFAAWMDRWYEETAGRAPSTLLFAGESFEQCAPDAPDAEMRLLAGKGAEHERAFLEKLRNEGRSVADLAGERDPEATRRALLSGVDVLYQPYLEAPPFFGYADFLLRCGDRPRYEVCDAKLARSIKPVFPLQLCLYSEMLAPLQGEIPERFHIALGSGETRSFRIERFLHLYRALRERFLAFQETFDPSAPPHPGDSPAHGGWSGTAGRILERLDSLARVANIAGSQRKKLEKAGIVRMKDLAETREERVPGLSPDVFARLREQASLQIASEGKERPEYRIVPSADGEELLPPASPGDVYFDIEGYPHAEGGLEYLWGAVGTDTSAPSGEGAVVFHDWWAHDAAGEKAAFEQFIDWVRARRTLHPGMHVYHYAPYETTAAKRLAAKYATREEEVDILLREGVFVDLYRVVRRALLVGTPGYSLKDVEHLYREKRSGDVATGGASVVAYHEWTVSGESGDWRKSPLLRHIRDYNEEDCRSTMDLGLWLREHLKEERVAPLDSPGESAVPSEREKTVRNEKNERRKELRRSLPGVLLEDVRGHADRPAAELLAGLVGYHWREAKPVFWRMYDRLARTGAELADDPDCLGMLRIAGEPRPDEKRSLIYPYTFPPDQETKIEQGKRCFANTTPTLSVEVHSLDTERGFVELRLGARNEPLPPLLDLVPDEYVGAETIEDSLHGIAQRWTEGTPPCGALRDLLDAAPPKLSDGRPFLYRPEDGVEGVLRLARDLGDSVLALQGPPGSGKTFTASRIIADLAASGQRIGVTANSHKAIMNLLAAVVEALDERGITAQVVKAGAGADEPLVANGRILPCKNGDLAEHIPEGAPVVLGATAWGFCRPEMEGMLDCLFIDEAGQFSLANAVACAPSASKLFLLGDQMQLAQPVQGTHPGKSGLSCLEHILGEHSVVPPDRGVFLEKSWRMHPELCAFVSDAFYEGRLRPLEGLERQEIRPIPGRHSIPWLVRGSGLLFVPVAHSGNGRSSDEEVERIASLTNDLLRCVYIDAQGEEHAMKMKDILFVAPYNLQVAKLRRRLGHEASVGSVDRFQGREAPVAILSMCSSSREESPRGMEFLCSPDRLNVAVSRARALAIVVGSPDLLSGNFSSIREMELANLYAWIMEKGDGASL